MRRTGNDLNESYLSLGAMKRTLLYTKSILRTRNAQVLVELVLKPFSCSKQHFSIKLILDNIMFFSIFSLLEWIFTNLGTLCSCSLCFHEENFSGTKVNTGHLNCFSYSGLL